MSLKQGTAQPSYSFGCGTNAPNGCLLNPEGSRLIFFEEIKNSHRNNLKIYTHVFYTNYIGEPAGFKSSEKLKVDSAWKSGTNFFQRDGQKYLTITDKSFKIFKN